MSPQRKQLLIGVAREGGPSQQISDKYHELTMRVFGPELELVWEKTLQRPDDERNYDWRYTLSDFDDTGNIAVLITTLKDELLPGELYVRLPLAQEDVLVELTRGLECLRRIQMVSHPEQDDLVILNAYSDEDCLHNAGVILTRIDQHTGELKKVAQSPFSVDLRASYHQSNKNNGAAEAEPKKMYMHSARLTRGGGTSRLGEIHHD